LGRGFVLREPSAAACDDQRLRFWPPRKWSTLPSIECRMVRHLSSKNRPRKAHSEVLRRQHEEYQFLAKSEAPTTKMFEPLASFNRADTQFHLEPLSAERSFHQRRKRGPDYLCDLQSLPRGLEKPPPSNYYASSLTPPRAARRLTNWEPPNYDGCRGPRLSTADRSPG
jgi:hypothetical protein